MIHSSGWAYGPWHLGIDNLARFGGNSAQSISGQPALRFMSFSAEKPKQYGVVSRA
jgi:hypothetical protein